MDSNDLKLFKSFLPFGIIVQAANSQWKPSELLPDCCLDSVSQSAIPRVSVQGILMVGFNLLPMSGAIPTLPRLRGATTGPLHPKTQLFPPSHCEFVDLNHSVLKRELCLAVVSVSIIRISTVPVQMLLGRVSFSVNHPQSFLHLRWKIKPVQTNNNFI